MVKPIELETQRLSLRQWRPADREPFAQLNADPRVMEFFPALLDRSASDALADRCQTLIAERGWGLWAAEIKQTGEFIGFIGLHTPMGLPFSPCVEIGWRLGFAYWGQGLATEAARAALRTGFAVLGLPEVVSFTAIQNVRSQAVMQRLGMVKVAHPFDHPNLLPDSPLRQHVLYRLSRQQWLDIQAAIQPGRAEIS